MGLAGYLFGDRPVTDHLKLTRQNLAAQINALTDLSTLDHDADECGRRARIEPCRVDRKAATMVPEPGATTVKVTLTLPVEGTTDLLKMRVPQDRGENILVQGDFRSSSFWPGEERTVARIEITESVPAGTSKDDIRAKLGQSADAIDANLEHINALVDEHNAAIAGEVGRLTEQRRAVLETTNSFRDDLGEGI